MSAEASRHQILDGVLTIGKSVFTAVRYDAVSFSVQSREARGDGATANRAPSLRLQFKELRHLPNRHSAQVEVIHNCIPSGLQPQSLRRRWWAGR